MIKATLFDFNGTLYFDSDINKKAWREIIDELSNKTIEFNTFYNKYKSVMDYIVIKKACEICRKKITETEVEDWVQKKEKRYRKLCLDLERNEMPKGATDLLNYLKERNIPRILVTSSIIENVDFYYQNLKLFKWFNKEETVYDDGTNNNKISMYKKAAKRLNINISDCLVFEDSPKSIKEAIEAGCKNVIAIKRIDTPDYKEIKQVIEDYAELDYSIFA